AVAAPTKTPSTRTPSTEGQPALVGAAIAAIDMQQDQSRLQPLPQESGCSKGPAGSVRGGSLVGRGAVAVFTVAVPVVVVAVADRAVHALDRLQALALTQADQGHALGVAADHGNLGG